MKSIFIGLLLCLALSLNAQQKVEFDLWPNGAPTSNGLTGDERMIDGTHVTNVTHPTLTVYIPQHCSGLAVIACPGGAYIDVWTMTEGHNLAEWYNQQGIVYAVLKYRLPNGHREVPLDDVHEAMKIMKAHQSEYGFRMLGIQGCSAGGHLAAMASTHYNNSDERPDFTILFYPVVSLDPSFTHVMSQENLLGKGASSELIDLYSNEKQVTSQTPPAFIMASSNDGLVPVRNSVEYYNALVANGISASLHLYPVGDHGWCGNESFPYRPQWMNELRFWLECINNQ